MDQARALSRSRDDIIETQLKVTKVKICSQAHGTPHSMTVQTHLGEPIHNMNVYAPIFTSDRDSMVENLLLLLPVYDGPMLTGGDFNLTLEPRLDRTYISLPGRHQFWALQRLHSQAELRDVFDDDMVIIIEDRAVPAFHAVDHIN